MSPFVLLITIYTCLSLIKSQTSQQCVSQLQCEKQDITADQIDCIGTQSCQAASITSSNRRNGYIECSGYESCNSNGTNKTEYPSILSASGDIFCSGSNSCLNVGAINAKQLYCTGESGCKSDLNSFGPLSTNLDIHCDASRACDSAAIEVGKKALCSGRSSCLGASISGGLF